MTCLFSRRTVTSWHGPAEVSCHPGESAKGAVTMKDLPEDEALGLFRTCSNTGRWGVDDQQGTLNYITAESRLAALQTVRTGDCVSLAADAHTAAIAEPGTPGYEHDMLYSWSPITCGDRIAFKVHGGAVTHIDCLGHEFFDGAAYNGRTAADIVGREGLTFGDVHALGGGIVTRGVLLDLEEQVPEVWPEGRVLARHLDECAERQGTDVRSGDALVVHLGTQSHTPAAGPEVHPGLGASSLPWLHAKQISVYLGDCIEYLPSGYDRLPFPLHQIGIAGMGLVLVDNCRLDDLVAHSRARGQYDFLLSIGPLRLKGATGAPVNPLCLL
jgi:kynurenine formamidase